MSESLLSTPAFTTQGQSTSIKQKLLSLILKLDREIEDQIESRDLFIERDDLILADFGSEKISIYKDFRHALLSVLVVD